MYTGLDEKQNKPADGNTQSNTGIVHKQKLELWNKRDDGGMIDYSGVRTGWVGYGTMHGISGNQLGNLAADFFKDFPMRNHGTIPKTGDGMIAFSDTQSIFVLYD